MHISKRSYVFILTLCIMAWWVGGFYENPAIAQTSTEISAFHRSGQTFLTWRERSDVGNEFYRVYRHTAVITATNLGSAESVALIPEGSAMYWTERWKVDYGLQPVQQNFIIEDWGNELDDNQGLFVYTTQQNEAGAIFYAITSEVSGIENRIIISGVNSLSTAVTESINEPEPVMVWESNSRFGRVYTQFMDFKNWNPTYTGYAYNYFVSLPEGYNPNEPYPLYLHIEGWGSRYSIEDGGGTPYGWQAIQIWCDDPHQSWYYGFSKSHNYGDNWPQNIYGGLSVPSSGQISNFTEGRILRTIQDVIRDPIYNVDENRIYAYGHSMGASGALALGMRYPDVFAAVMCSMPMTNYSGDNPDIDANWLEDYAAKWGNITNNLPIINEGNNAEHLVQYNNQGVYDWMNHQQNMILRREDEMAYIFTAHGKLDLCIEWETQGQPWIELMATLAKRGWKGSAINTTHDNPQFLDMDQDPNFVWENFNFRKDKSYPAFSNFSLNPLQNNDNSYYNFGIEWACPWNIHEDFRDDIVDTRERYEIILRLYEHWTFGSVPNSATVDITPRRLQQFVVTPSQSYDWENIQSPGNTNVIQSGTVTADVEGLVTISNFKVTKTGNKLRITSSSSVEDDENFIPYKYSLEQNYPNPFNSTARIRFSIPRTNHVELIIYDISGRAIVTLVDKILGAGEYAINWDGRDHKGIAVASGVYFYSFKADNYLSTRKLILVR